MTLAKECSKRCVENEEIDSLADDKMIVPYQLCWCAVSACMHSRIPLLETIRIVMSAKGNFG
jgi:hypothetical protein